LLMWGALSDERTGLSFTTAASPLQHSQPRIRVPWDWLPYFIVSDSRLPFSSPSRTRRATLEVFNLFCWVKSQSHIATDGESVSLGVEPQCGAHDEISITV
jgi:hypothetical protein